MWNQTKEALVKWIYENKKAGRDTVLSDLLSFFKKKWFKEWDNKDFSFAYWKIYLNIDTFFQEKDNWLSASSWHSPVIVWFWNINGKTSNKLFWKWNDIKDNIEKASKKFGEINKKTEEAINFVDEEYPKQNVSYATIWKKINPGAF